MHPVEAVKRVFQACCMVGLRGIVVLSVLLSASTAARAQRPDHKDFGGMCAAGCHPSEQRARGAQHPVLAEDGPCEACHDPAANSEPPFLKTGDAGRLCLSCHFDLQERGTDAHAPAEGGMCLTCHSAHAGATTREAHTQPEPCVSCHTEILADRANQHSAIAEFGCTGCHDPHWAPNTPQIRAFEGKTICFRCHQDDATGRKVVHQPVADGQCGLCHDPHGSNNKANLLRDPVATCTMCHPDKDRDYKVPHSPVRMGCTTTCHDPHASDSLARLQADIITVCTTCHPDHDDGRHIIQGVGGKGHPMGGDYMDPLRPEHPLDCTSCHLPHGGDNPRRWQYAETRLELCAQCHTDLPFSPNPKFLEAMGLSTSDAGQSGSLDAPSQGNNDARDEKGQSGDDSPSAVPPPTGIGDPKNPVSGSEQQ